MNIEIGSYEAKTKLPALLRDVQCGGRYTITLRGAPVAELVPIQFSRAAERREAVDAMRALPMVKGVPDAEVDDWINEGRR